MLQDINPKNNNEKLVARLTIAKNVLEENFSENVNIDALAKGVSFSKFHFCRSFKNAFGLSPHQFVLNKRLERSAELIIEGKLMITDIAYEVGFSDIYSFSKSFKKRFNASPSRFSETTSLIYNFAE
ncbi:MAG: AraC family transcriptional regulator [Ginsengibacter sp.]